MTQKKKPLEKCQVCGETKSLGSMIHGELVRPAIADLIRRDLPDWKSNGYICAADMNKYRADYIEDIIETEKGELTSIDREVLKSIVEKELLARDTDKDFEQKLSFGERIADKVADFGGSWSFIISFSVILACWIAFNTIAVVHNHFDPYPFILLNLILSTIAALQAPVIMMSQNRQDARDRVRSENDYQVNLKAEIEIRHLNEKLEHLLSKQWQRLLEIQQIQVELLEELSGRHNK